MKPTPEEYQALLERSWAPCTVNPMAAIVGATVGAVEGAEPGSEIVRIHTDRGTLTLWHGQDCCESVEVEDVVGDPADLIGGTVTAMEERGGGSVESGGDRATWTFYDLRTTKGDLTIRWLGSSNGYYSESVDVDWLPKETVTRHAPPLWRLE